VLEWEPGISLEEGLGATYGWICDQLGKEGRLPAPAAYRTMAANA
jgi:hypothetical protein